MERNNILKNREHSIGLAKKSRYVFYIQWLQYCLVVFNFIQNNFVILYCDGCHISVH